jgi:hypothetical protein
MERAVASQPPPAPEGATIVSAFSGYLEEAAPVGAAVPLSAAAGELLAPPLLLLPHAIKLAAKMMEPDTFKTLDKGKCNNENPP